MVDRPGHRSRQLQYDKTRSVRAPPPPPGPLAPEPDAKDGSSLITQQNAHPHPTSSGEQARSSHGKPNIKFCAHRMKDDSHAPLDSRPVHASRSQHNHGASAARQNEELTTYNPTVTEPSLHGSHWLTTWPVKPLCKTARFFQTTRTSTFFRVHLNSPASPERLFPLLRLPGRMAA